MDRMATLVIVLVRCCPLIFLHIIFAAHAPALAWTSLDSERLIEQMEASYREVADYQTHLIITGFGKDSFFEKSQKLDYIFKKPNKIRIDFETPHAGMLIIYPDRDGKVILCFNAQYPSFSLHLRSDNSILEISPGQRIDQTDLGMLIRNISHSLTDLFLGGLDVKEDADRLIIGMLSDNPFRRGTPTRYVFTIDKKLWLPVMVLEYTPEGILQRKVVYEKLKLNTGIREELFQLD